MGRSSKRKQSRHKKGSRKGWATPEQYNWLQEQVPAFLALKADGKRRLNSFWLQLYDGWFERWPEESTSQELADKTEARRTVCIVI